MLYTGLFLVGSAATHSGDENAPAREVIVALGSLAPYHARTCHFLRSFLEHSLYPNRMTGTTMIIYIYDFVNTCILATRLTFAY